MINKIYSVLIEIYRDYESSVVSNVVFFFMFAIFDWGSWYFVNDLRIFEMTVESHSISSETLPVEKSLAIYD